VAVLFHRLGPYHFARLQAAGRLLSIVAIESSGVDETYAWDVVAGADHFERVTLFDRADALKLPAAEVASRVGLALDKAQPSVVVVPGWADSAALGALRWCVQNQVPAVVMSESTAWDEKRSGWREWVKRRIVGLCSAALVGGTPHKDYMVQLGMPAERIFLGYDAVDNGYFQGKAEMLKTESINKYGLPARYFLASARFVEKKNLPRLIQAYARYRALAQRSESIGENVESGKQKAETQNKLETPKAACEIGKATSRAEENKNEFQLSAFPISAFKDDPRPPTTDLWHLVLLGDGPLKSDLCCLISDLGLQHCVLLPGFKQYPDLPAYYGLASAFVHASTTEQWGLVVNEAMASGLPVLVSNRCGCARDLVQEGKNGFTFDPCNVEQLASLMLNISAFNFPLSAFGSESHRLISHWGPERFASGLQQAVETALRTSVPKPSLIDSFLLRALLMR
jgi:glycosyltransferase involved in cell wall biosynthesis